GAARHRWATVSTRPHSFARPQTHHRSDAAAAARCASPVPAAGPLSTAHLRVAEIDHERHALRLGRVFLGARGQPRHQQACRAPRCRPVQDVSDLPEGAQLIRTVAVTGATGSLGRHLTADLVRRGVEVRAIVRPGSTSAEPAGATIVRAPLQADALGPGLDGVDAVVHLAGVVSAVDAATYASVNADG